jgi:xanthine dehydrogenase accessory factor
MHAELLRLASELAGREEPFVLAVVVRRQPASSAQAGDMALITAAGEFHGWLGGSCTQPTVVREARRALADGRPRLLALAPDPEAERRPGVAVFPMTCHSGGSVEIYLDPILPAVRLLVFGVSPIARALAKLGKAMGYSVYAVDAAAEPAMFPGADLVLTRTAAPELVGAATPATRRGGAGGGAGGLAGGGKAASASELWRGACFAVVATMGERDEEAIREALALRPAYLGVVASARRFAQLRRSLLARGVEAAALDSIRSPAGVAIGAQAPEEIAVSVLAEIVARRRAATPAGIADTADAADGAAAATAVDPICGMTVETAGARHTVEAGGRTWYFCGSGCRERFLAAPERLAAPRPSRPPESSPKLRKPRKPRKAFTPPTPRPERAPRPGRPGRPRRPRRTSGSA